MLETRAALPSEFARDLRSLYHPGAAASKSLCAVLAHARAVGWTLQAMGDALGVSRERIRQLAPQAILRLDLLPIAVPSAPVVEHKPKPAPRIAVCGTLGGVKKHRRLGEKPCDACREKWRTYISEQKARRDPVDAPVHGKESTYCNWRCRCELCKAAHSVAMGKRYRGARR